MRPRPIWPWLLLLALLAPAPARALTPTLISDYAADRQPVLANPRLLTAIGERLFFVAGEQVWSSDGTPEGTRAATPQLLGTLQIQSFAGQVLVAGASCGLELFSTDGSPESVAPLFAPGTVDPSGVWQLIPFAERVYALTRTAIWSWRPDGGPELLLRFEPAEQPYLLVATASGFAFATVAPGGIRVWRSDGTSAGTRVASSITTLNLPEQLLAIGDVLYLIAGDMLLRIADGPAPELRLPVPFGSRAAVLGQTLYVAERETGLYSMSVAEDQPSLVPGVAFIPSELRSCGSRLYLIVFGDTRMAAIDSTGVPTPLQLDAPLMLTDCDGDRLFFTDNNLRLGVSDGSEIGTRLLSVLPTGFSLEVESVGETTYISTQGGLFKTDRAGLGPLELVRDQVELPSTSAPFFNLLGPDRVGLHISLRSLSLTLEIFHGGKPTPVPQSVGPQSEAGGHRLSFGPTAIASDGEIIFTVPDNRVIQPLQVIGRRMMFFVSDQNQTLAVVFVTDGTREGTVAIADGFPGSVAEMERDGTFLFALTVFGMPPEGLWRSDGTREGTHFVGTALGPIYQIVPLSRGMLLQVGPLDTSGWWSLEPGDVLTRLNLPPSEIVNRTRDRAFLQTYPELNGNAVSLLASDGSVNGSGRLTSVWGARLGRVAALDSGTLLFKAAAPLGAPGSILYALAEGSSDASELARFACDQDLDVANAGGAQVIFSGTDASGVEPWISDGTKAGTQLLLDMMPGPFSSYAAQFVFDGHRVYFGAETPEVGREPWRIDVIPDDYYAPKVSQTDDGCTCRASGGGAARPQATPSSSLIFVLLAWLRPRGAGAGRPARSEKQSR